jgi:hypothetical protein
MNNLKRNYVEQLFKLHKYREMNFVLKIYSHKKINYLNEELKIFN